MKSISSAVKWGKKMKKAIQENEKKEVIAVRLKMPEK